MAEVLLFPLVGQTVLIRIVSDIGGEKIETKEIFDLADISDREVIWWIGTTSPRITIGVSDCNEAIVERPNCVLKLTKVYRSEVVSLRAGLVPAVNEVCKAIARAAGQAFIKFSHCRRGDILQLALIGQGIVVRRCIRI